MDRSIHEQHLYQSLRTNKEHFKIALTFLTGSNGIFNVTDKKNNFFFTESISDEDGFQI